MKLSPFLLSGALAVAIGLPIVGCAQQAPAQSQSGASQGAYGHHRHGMRWLQGVNLTDQQKQQIQNLMQQYRQAHPQGSQPDPQARQQLRQQVMNVLTPAQRAQVEQNMQKMRSERDERGGEGSAAPSPSASPAP
jgi:Spy/CpxP family protein refolding chaperone